MRFAMFLWYFEGHTESFKVKMVNSEGLSQTKFLETVESNMKFKKKKVKAKDMFAYRFYEKDSVCFFRASSFSSFNEDFTENIWVRKKLLKILDNLVDDMNKRKSSTLIVDIRSNGGGDTDYGEELLKRVSSRPFKKPQSHTRNSRAARKAYIINALEKNRIPAFFHLENIIDFNLYGLKSKDFEIEGQYWYGRQRLIEPFADNWNGRLVVLVNGLTGSAASEFAGVVKDNQLGIIVGKETGGRASFYGGLVPIILPNSGLVCNLSTDKIIRPAGFDDGRGVLPDLELDVTEDDEVLVEKIYNYIMMNPQN
jgi:C-terminal processing protease CtpA/Prc